MKHNLIRVYSDASYHAATGGYGFGAVIIKDRIMTQYGLYGIAQKHEPSSAFWECLAIQHALDHLNNARYVPVHVYTDSKEIVVGGRYHAILRDKFPWLNIEKYIHRSDHACGHIMTCHMIANRVRRYKHSYYRQIILPQTA